MKNELLKKIHILQKVVQELFQHVPVVFFCKPLTVLECWVSLDRIVEFFSMKEVCGLPGSNKKNIEYYTKFKDDTLVITNASFQSDPDLVTPDLVTPRFSDMINFPRYRKLTVFHPD
eukprot:sb/3476564/